MLYDGTEPGKRALDAAARLVGYGSTLTVVAVGSDGAPADGTTRDDLARQAGERLASRQVVARYVDAADSLAEILRHVASDLLVIGRDPRAADVLALVAGAPGDVLLVR